MLHLRYDPLRCLLVKEWRRQSTGVRQSRSPARSRPTTLRAQRGSKALGRCATGLREEISATRMTYVSLLKPSPPWLRRSVYVPKPRKASRGNRDRGHKPGIRSQRFTDFLCVRTAFPIAHLRLAEIGSLANRKWRRSCRQQLCASRLSAFSLASRKRDWPPRSPCCLFMDWAWRRRIGLHVSATGAAPSNVTRPPPAPPMRA
jgi:hypothetical protein